MKPDFTSLVTLLLIAPFMDCAAETLVVYPPVPALAASEHYKVRVRSVRDGGLWQNAFAWETACKKVGKNTGVTVRLR